MANRGAGGAAGAGGGGGGAPQNEYVEFTVKAEEDLYLTGSENTIRRVTADTNYSCLMLKTQRFSDLFRHYAKYHGLRKDDLEYYFVHPLENEDTPESVQLLRGDIIMVRKKRKPDPPEPAADDTVKSKRKISTSRSGGLLSTKKKQKENNNALPSVFDQLCDESLLNILSYTDDLRSLIYLTRCTSKSLRRRFDPKPQGGNNDGNKPQYYSEQCTKTFWQGVFADLCMTPLEDSDSKSHNYVAAINYRLSLFNTLIQSDKRKKASGNNATKRCYSLPLRHHNLKPLEQSWNFDQPEYGSDDFINDNDGGIVPMINPFALLSKGTGMEYVIVDPKLGSIDVHKSIMEDALCLDKSVQKKREEENSLIHDDRGWPSQVLLNSYHHSINTETEYSRFQTRICRERGDGNRSLQKWEEYFGDNTPFGANQANPWECYVYAACVKVVTFDSMDDDRILLKEKQILLRRILTDHEERRCSEFIIWGDGYPKTPSKRFELKSMIRIPTVVFFEAFSLHGDKVFCLLNQDRFNHGNLDRAVYQFSLSSSNEDEQYYVQPDFFFMAENCVTYLQPIGRNHILVGTEAGTIEIWDVKNDDRDPYLVKTLHATDAFTNAHDNSILILLFGQESLHNSFVSVQESSNEGAVISLWQTEVNTDFSDFQMVSKVRYESRIRVACSASALMVLHHDKFGCLYLDIYHMLGSRFALNEFDNINLPKNVEMTNLHSSGDQRLQFANRINIRHRLPLYKDVNNLALDINDRFIVICANDGLIGNNGETKTGPGLIVIDLDDQTVSP